MTKKHIYILFICFSLLILFISKKEKTSMVFNNNIYRYDKYILNFNECDMNTNNFINVFSYLKDKDFKILEVIPYINITNKNILYNEKFLYYTNNIEYVLNDFKNKYMNIMLDNSKYVSNICIKNITIYTSNEYLSNFNYNSTK